VSQLVVATECPSCGAPLDVSEGANTIRCGNCRSNLLVTGRKQVLSYYVPARITEETARALAMTRPPATRVVTVELHFIPYYRLTGHDLGWQAGAAEPSPGHDAAGDPTLALFRSAHAEGRALAAAIMRGQAPTRMSEHGPLKLLDRYVEKNFVARDIPELSAYSLGVRAQVLRVELVKAGTLEQLGKAVGIGIDVPAAIARGLTDGTADRLIYRQVLARTLSVIYFPYWVIEHEDRGESWLTLVDGVTERVAQAGAPRSLRQALGARASGDLPTAGFRPLVCPNCGWDLPVSADDVVFVCASCEKAWQLQGTEMTDVPHEIAAVSGAGDAVYLPFWQLEGGARSCCVPAFRYRRLKALADLAARLAATPLRFDRWTGPRPRLRGCFYDFDDACLLAQFVAVGAGSPTVERPGGGKLVWLPFKREGRSLIDPFTGMGLQEGLLV
jgi:LSD1 subclass zinc finger protein